LVFAALTKTKLMVALKCFQPICERLWKYKTIILLTIPRFIPAHYELVKRSNSHALAAKITDENEVAMEGIEVAP
jgi:hypothetical protein